MTQMQSQLSAVPAPQRRRAALALGLIAALLVAMGVLPWTGSASVLVRVIGLVAIAAGVLAGLVAWGLARSITQDARRTAEAQLDALLAEAAGGCDCGHDHGAAGHDHADHGEAQSPACVHGSDDPNCAHDCASCVLSQRR